MRASSARPIAASGWGIIWSHIGPWTWWTIVSRGRRYHTGENHGTPFQISTSASDRPIRPSTSATAGSREHAVAAAPPDHVVAVPSERAGGSPAADVRMDDVEPGRRPAPHHLVGVDLGAAGVGIVEIAPGEHVDAPDPGGAQVGGEVVDGRHGLERTADAGLRTATSGPLTCRHREQASCGGRSRSSVSSRSSPIGSLVVDLPALPAERRDADGGLRRAPGRRAALADAARDLRRRPGRRRRRQRRRASTRRPLPRRPPAARRSATTSGSSAR